MAERVARVYVYNSSGQDIGFSMSASPGLLAPSPPFFFSTVLTPYHLSRNLWQRFSFGAGTTTPFKCGPLSAMVGLPDYERVAAAEARLFESSKYELACRKAFDGLAPALGTKGDLSEKDCAAVAALHDNLSYAESAVRVAQLHVDLARRGLQMPQADMEEAEKNAAAPPKPSYSPPPARGPGHSGRALNPRAVPLESKDGVSRLCFRDTLLFCALIRRKSPFSPTPTTPPLSHTHSVHCGFHSQGTKIHHHCPASHGSDPKRHQPS